MSCRANVAAVVLSLLCGCTSIQSPSTKIDVAERQVRSATIVYKAPFKTTANEQDGSKVRVLSLQYPSSGCRPGFARAELITGRVMSPEALASESKRVGARLSAAIGANLPGVQLGPGIEEAMSAEIPIREVEQVIHTLEMANFFGPATPSSPNTTVQARLNGTQYNKPWRRVAELEKLAVRIREEGKVVSHPEPLLADDEPTRTASVAGPAIERLPAVLR